MTSSNCCSGEKTEAQRREKAWPRIQSQQLQQPCLTRIRTEECPYPFQTGGGVKKWHRIEREYVRRFWIASSSQDLVPGLRSHTLERRLGEDEKALPLEIIMIQLHERRTRPSFWGEILVKLLNCLVFLHSLLSFYFLRNFHFIFFSEHFQCEGLGNYIKFERSKFPIYLFQYRMPATHIQHMIFEW